MRVQVNQEMQPHIYKCGNMIGVGRQMLGS